MSLINLPVMGGMVPILDKKLLPADKGQLVRNALIGSGSLTPLRNTLDAGVTLPANTKTAYLYAKDPDKWFSWSTDVDVQPSPIADDDWGRAYWTGDGAPKMTVASIATQSGASRWPSASYLLGIPAPDTLPATTVQPDEDPDAMPVSVTYAVAYVSAYGEIGPPGGATALVSRPDGHGVNITGIPVPSGNHNLPFKRIYRSSGGAYLQVAQIPAAQTSYVDTVQDQALGSSLVSMDWDMPNENMVGLTLLPTGVFAGFFDNVLCFSEPYLPHAWPTNYRLTTKAKIVGLQTTASGLVVLTEERPYLCVGSVPSAMQLMEMDVKQPCLSKASHVDMGSYSLYASPDGLVAAGGSEPRVITAGIVSKNQWMALNPSSMRAFEYNGRYVAQHDGGGFIFNPATGDVTELDISHDGYHYDTARDALYLLQSGTLKQFDAGTPMMARFLSKCFDQPGHAPMVAAKVEAAGYPVTFRIFGDDSLVYELLVFDSDPFRLPTGKRYGQVDIEIESQFVVSRVQASVAMGAIV